MNALTLPLRRVVASSWRRLAERPSLQLLACNLAAQLFAVAFAPLLARLYSPEQFGALGTISTIVMVCSPLASGRYDLALPRAAGERDAQALIRLCLLTIGTFGVVSGVAAWATAAFGHGGLATVLVSRWPFVPLGIACVAVYDMLAVEASRQGELRTLALSKLTQAGSGVGSQLLLGLAGVTSIGLLVGFVLNQAMGVGRLLRELVLQRAGKIDIAWPDIRRVAWLHRRSPLFASWTAALDAASKYGLQFCIAVFWSPQVAGYLFLTDRLVARPLQLVSTSLLPVYVANLSRDLHQAPERLPGHFRNTLMRQTVLAVGWTIAVIALAPLVVGPLFGPNWAGAVPYVQVMTIGIAPAACLHAVTHTLQVTGRQRLDAALVVARLGALAGVIAWGRAAHLDALSEIWCFASLQALFALLTWLAYRHALRAAARPLV